jgi:hypothetical protein
LYGVLLCCGCCIGCRRIGWSVRSVTYSLEDSHRHKRTCCMHAFEYAFERTDVQRHPTSKACVLLYVLVSVSMILFVFHQRPKEALVEQSGTPIRLGTATFVNHMMGLLILLHTILPHSGAKPHLLRWPGQGAVRAGAPEKAGRNLLGATG